MSKGSNSPTSGDPRGDPPSDELFVEGADSSPEIDESPDGTFDQDAVVQLQNQVDDANSRLVRSQAELDNFRKRSRREMEDQRRHAQFPIMSDLLAVVDNLERAIQATGQAETDNQQGLQEGVHLVTDQLKSILERHHCQMIEVGEGDVFDPNCHEAISQQPSEDHPTGSVLFVTQSGYRLHERIVRPAQVVVSTGSDDLQASS